MSPNLEHNTYIRTYVRTYIHTAHYLTLPYLILHYITYIHIIHIYIYKCILYIHIPWNPLKSSHGSNVQTHGQAGTTETTELDESDTSDSPATSNDQAGGDNFLNYNCTLKNKSLGPIDINLCELLFLNELAGVNYSFFQTWNGDLTCFPKMTIKTKTRKYVFTWIFRQFMFSAFSQKGRNFCCFGGTMIPKFHESRVAFRSSKVACSEMWFFEAVYKKRISRKM